MNPIIGPDRVLIATWVIASALLFIGANWQIAALISIATPLALAALGMTIWTALAHYLRHEDE